MIQEPLVSIVIPAYNAEKFIATTLDSVLAQTYKNYELIVVDDGSNDKTAEVVEEYLKKHCIRGLCIRQENKKIAGARNTGIRVASGSWIALLDHDDIWLATKLEKVMKELSAHPEVEFIWHHLRFRKDGVYLRHIRKPSLSNNMYYTLLFKGITISPSAAIFLKEAALSIGGFCENPDFNTIEDFDFWLRLSQKARFHFLDEKLVDVLRHKSSASQKVTYHHRNMEIVLRSHLDKYLTGGMGIRMKLKARKRLAVVYRSCLSQLMGYKENVSAQKSMAKKMIFTCPWDWKNIVQFIRCAICS